MTQLRVFSNGGGVQSTAALVLAARAMFMRGLQIYGLVDWLDEQWQEVRPLIPNPTITLDDFLQIMNFPIFIHANVGEDSENPETVAYVQNTHPLITEEWRTNDEKISLVTVRRIKRNGDQPTLLQHIEASRRSLPIPVRMANGAPGTRSCTADYKIAPVDKWLKQHGASAKRPATIGLGISLDEIQRMRTAYDSTAPYRLREYPLIALRLRRDDCVRIIAEAGLPPAPKSSCWFCPFHRRQVWQEMHDKQPELFQKSVELERMLNARRVLLGRDAVWLTPYNMPLDQVIMADQADMFDDNCESGYCHT